MAILQQIGMFEPYRCTLVTMKVCALKDKGFLDSVWREEANAHIHVLHREPDLIHL